MKNKSFSRKVNLTFKRTFDIFGSGIGLIAVSPIMLISLILIKITMPGKIFFKQVRVGKDEKLFSILKFRTMKVDKEAEANHDSSKDEERKTPFGSFMRRTKIDELPQLFNVFIGDMSLIGPRPTFAEQADKYDDFQKKRLTMRPGMTGLAQINGNTAISWEERIKYDLKYINEFNLLLDIRILLGTVKVVLFGEEKYAKILDEEVTKK